MHPTAVIEGDVEVGPGTTVGPWCLLLGTVGPVRIGANCTLIAHATVNGPTILGDGNVLYPQVNLGFAPQDIGFPPDRAGPGCVIGSRNTFREGVTVHRGKTALPTRIGDENLWMTCTHLGHDGVVGNNCIVGSNAVLAGHVEVADRVIIGGCTAVHQFVRIGHHALVSGLAGAARDVPPWFTVTATNLIGSLNVVGLRRSGTSPSDIEAVRWAFKAIYRSGRTPQQALETLRTRESHPVIAEYIRFISESKRGLCHGSGRANRGTAGRLDAGDRGGD